MIGGYWEEAKNRRKVFEELVKKNGKDPLLPATWYSSMDLIKPNSVCYFFKMKIYLFVIILFYIVYRYLIILQNFIES